MQETLHKYIKSMVTIGIGDRSYLHDPGIITNKPLHFFLFFHTALEIFSKCFMGILNSRSMLCEHR